VFLLVLLIFTYPPPRGRGRLVCHMTGAGMVFHREAPDQSSRLYPAGSCGPASAASFTPSDVTSSRRSPDREFQYDGQQYSAGYTVSLDAQG